MKELPIIIKADVQGSAEVLADTLTKLSDERVKIRIIHSGVGAINESDVLLAAASNAIVIGFNVRPDRNASDVAERDKVDIRLHSVIYNVVDEMKKAMTGTARADAARSEARQRRSARTFKVPKFGTIAGCMVLEGRITRSGDAQARLLRDNVVIHEGKIGSLRRFKDDVSEVKSGFECGIGFERYNDIKVGDVIEVFVVERVAATVWRLQMQNAVLKASFCILHAAFCIMSSRPERVGDQIRSELAQLLAREVHDPGVGFLTLTQVKVTSDLQLARVYYTSFGDDKAQRESAKALKRAAPFLRRQLGQRLGSGGSPSSTSSTTNPSLVRIASNRSSRSSKRRPRPGMTPVGTMTSANADSAPAEICQAIKERTRFLITSHARPDGDSIGSQLAMAYALDLLGKQVRLVNADRRAGALPGVPGRRSHRDRPRSHGRRRRCGDRDGVGDFARTGVKGSTDASRSTSTIIRATAATATSTGSTSPRPRAASWSSS